MNKIFMGIILLSGFLFASNAKTNVENVCSNCHGFWMDEGGLGVSLAPNTLPHKEILNKLRNYKKGTLSQYGMGYTMKDQLNNMSDEDLIDLSKYIPTLKK